MKKGAKLKAVPAYKSDRAAEKFVDTADLSQFDFSAFRPMRFELQAKTATVSMRLPEALLANLKSFAKKQGIPYQRLMRQFLEDGLSQSPKKKRA